MAAAASPSVPASSQASRRVPARSIILTAAAASLGWRWRREPYPAVSVAAGSARSMPGALTMYSSKVDVLLDSVKWDNKGLAVAIAQNVDTGAILMQGFANKEALEKTISTRKATFFSRSRSSLWTKGETSMNFINVHDILLDCDRDSIIYLGKPDGPTCHTGAETCYYTSVYDALQDSETTSQERLVTTTLYLLEDIISRRHEEIATEGSGKPSWTEKLLLDIQLLCSKIRQQRKHGGRTASMAMRRVTLARRQAWRASFTRRPARRRLASTRLGTESGQRTVRRGGAAGHGSDLEWQLGTARRGAKAESHVGDVVQVFSAHQEHESEQIRGLAPSVWASKSSAAWVVPGVDSGAELLHAAELVSFPQLHLSTRPSSSLACDGIRAEGRRRHAWRHDAPPHPGAAASPATSPRCRGRPNRPGTAQRGRQ